MVEPQRLPAGMAETAVFLVGHVDAEILNGFQYHPYASSKGNGPGRSQFNVVGCERRPARCMFGLG